MSFDPSKPVRTRDGREVGIYAFDVADRYSIHGFIVQENGNMNVAAWDSDGFYDHEGDPMGVDLVNVPEYPPLPEVEGGRLEYRGKGWTNYSKPTRFFIALNGRWVEQRSTIPSGDNSYHYAEFIPNDPTTVRGWLETLPDGYRERALTNLEESDGSMKDETSSFSLEGALLYAFSWKETKEGEDFWRAVSKGNLPPLPLDPKLVPYTLQTFPMWAVWVRLHGSVSYSAITSITGRGVETMNVGIAFLELCASYHIAGDDGIWHPAGQEEQS